MAKVIIDGVQNFATLRENNYFYIDKTAFLSEWWNPADAGSEVSLITRPRRFGKTLMLSTVEHFFSSKYAGRSDLFEGLDVWQDEEMRALQGTFPVVFLSLANVKGKNFAALRERLVLQIVRLFSQFRYLKNASELDQDDIGRFAAIRVGMSDGIATDSLALLCELLHRAHGKKVIVLLDEYDTPLQEAWLNSCWDDTVDFLRNLLNSTFKTNPNLARGILTGITRVSKESIFSDLNNLGVYSVSTPYYETSFGFTEKEVFAAMAERGLTDKAGVKAMYDGYIFGGIKGIYNPWSVASYLKDPRFETWWANTSSNAIVGNLVREGSAELKQDFQTLLEGGCIQSVIDEQIVYDDLDDGASIWSLLLATGYLKVEKIMDQGEETIYTLSLTNGEIRRIMDSLVRAWFKKARSAYGKFVKALLDGDLDEMNEYMNEVALDCFSYFDTAGKSERSQPERFYHGFVLGLLVELRDRYVLTSNRESGSGRHDIMLEPRKPDEDPAFVIEFKVHKPKKEKTLEETVAAALAQIEAKGYEQQLLASGIPADRIRKYGFAFRGKEVLIGQK